MKHVIAHRRTLLPLGGVLLVLIIGVVAALVWHASTLESHDDVRGRVDVSTVDVWAAPFGYVLVGGNDSGQAFELVALADDGTVRGRMELPSGRLAEIGAAGDVVFSDNADPDTLGPEVSEITAHRIEGDSLQQLWSQGFTVEGSDEPLGELDVVAHDDRGRTTVHGCSASDGCWLIGVDLTGEELWHLDADGLQPAASAERDGGQRPWLVPEELSAIRSSTVVRAPENRPVLAIDTATGAFEEVTTGARVVTGDGFSAVSRLEDDGCGVEVVRNGAVTWRTDGPCDEDERTPLINVQGDTVSYRSGDEVVVIDVADETMGTIPGGIPGGVGTYRTGVGTVLEAEDGLVLRRIADGEVLHRAGSGWVARSIGDDAVVLQRDHRSANPFASRKITEVVVIDVADGSVCARGRFEGGPAQDSPAMHRPFRALAGCTALAEIGGVTYLLGPDR